MAVVTDGVFLAHSVTVRFAPLVLVLALAGACADPTSPVSDVGFADAGFLDARPLPEDAGFPDATVEDGGFLLRAGNLAPTTGEATTERFRLKGRLSPGAGAADSPNNHLRGGLVPTSP